MSLSNGYGNGDYITKVVSGEVPNYAAYESQQVREHIRRSKLATKAAMPPPVMPDLTDKLVRQAAMGRFSQLSRRSRSSTFLAGSLASTPKTLMGL